MADDVEFKPSKVTILNRSDNRIGIEIVFAHRVSVFIMTGDCQEGVTVSWFSGEGTEGLSRWCYL